jgi:uncharacterized membrane-anchored protein YhcB (DUF1043 family)
MSKTRGFLVVALLVTGFVMGITASALTSESHPEIHKAQKFLGQAKTALENAAHDYQGHRVKAIDFINDAQHELKVALEVDKK